MVRITPFRSSKDNAKLSVRHRTQYLRHPRKRVFVERDGGDETVDLRWKELSSNFGTYCLRALTSRAGRPVKPRVLLRTINSPGTTI